MADMNRNPNNRRYERKSNATPWVLGGVAALALLGMAAYFASDHNRTAVNSGPGTNTTTTGSSNTGSTAPANTTPAPSTPSQAR